nr:hypothetical protein GCM10020185_19410 [Pseudomonas brassicacearum subsp. brassicacearum]
MISILRRGLLVLLAALPLMANAVAAPSAHDIIQDTTTRLLADLSANKEKYKQDPSAFYDALNGIVGPVVDADGISKSIMTVKYSRKASPAQMTRFQENFKRSLMQFYGNALLEYNNQGITVSPAKDESGTRTSVDMQVKGNNGAIYPVSYTLEKNQRRVEGAQRDHQWHQHRQAVPRSVRRRDAAQWQRPGQDHQRLGR